MFYRRYIINYKWERAESNRHHGIFGPTLSRLSYAPLMLAGPRGFEPPAKRLRAARSDLAELRARYVSPRRRDRTCLKVVYGHLPLQSACPGSCVPRSFLVDLTGFEPALIGLKGRCPSLSGPQVLLAPRTGLEPANVPVNSRVPRPLQVPRHGRSCSDIRGTVGAAGFEPAQSCFQSRGPGQIGRRTHLSSRSSG